MNKQLVITAALLGSLFAIPLLGENAAIIKLIYRGRMIINGVSSKVEITGNVSETQLAWTPLEPLPLDIEEVKARARLAIATTGCGVNSTIVGIDIVRGFDGIWLIRVRSFASAGFIGHPCTPLFFSIDGVLYIPAVAKE